MPGSQDDKNRRLTPEERKLWRQAVRHVKPLRQVLQEEPEYEAKEPQAAEKKPALRKQPAAAAPRASKPAFVPLASGDYRQLDGALAQRLKRGDYPVNAKLDLHFMTRTEAHAALVRQVEHMLSRRGRCLLVITGKGERVQGREETGVLRAELPRWLNASPLIGHILAFGPAHLRHGGSGAFYVLLKRQKER